MLVAIRADATTSSGVGHAMRCLALAEEFVQSGDRIHWIGDLASQPWLVDQVSHLTKSITEPAGSESEQAKQILKFDPDLTIVDSYSLGEAFCSQVQRHSNVLMAIIDASSHLPHADMFVSPNVDSIAGEIVQSVPMLHGVPYVLIRKELRRIKMQMNNWGPQYSGSSRPLRVAVLLGGTDVAGLAPRLVKSLVSLGVRLSISAVPRPITLAVTPGEVHRIGSSTVCWWNAGRDIYSHVVEADLIISAAGVSSWEFLYLGLPLALIQVADNQASNYDWMTAQGYAWGIGRSAEFQDSRPLTTALGRLLDLDLDSLRFPKSIVDGLGARRVVSAAYELVQGRNS